MKKLILSVCLMFLVSGVMAQNNSKNGHQITPETDDWGLGIDANPFLNYLGDMFNGSSGNSSPWWNYNDGSPIPFTITGFMIKDENTAYRGKLRLGIGSTKRISIIDQDGSTSTPSATVEDELKTSATNILISAGIQKMRGKHRVKGIYGAEVLIGSGNGGKSTYSYGNSFNMDSTSFDYGSATITDWTYGGTNSVSSRTTEDKSGSTFYFGLRGFVGVEYFIAPKLSLAGEFGWGVGMASTGEGETTTEYVDQGSTPFFNDNSVRTMTSKTGKSSSFGLDTDNGNMFSSNGGSLRMTFYF